MPGLFEQFPHTNLHELNLDWIIDLINQFKEELEDSAVLSVNGQTGHVTLYESENVILPPLTEASSWRLVRMIDGQYVGILFQDGHIWLQQGNSTLKLLTTEDIPTSAGVVSINGRGGIVTLTGRDIAIDDSPDADSVRLALETERTERVNADNALQNAINTTNQHLSNFLGYGNSLRSKNIDTYNDYTYTGIYFYNGYSTGEEATSGTTPFTNAYGLIFMFDNGFGGFIQVALNIMNAKVYRRTYQSGAWNIWAESA